MNEPKYWNGWLRDNSKSPHEAISSAIQSAEELMAALHKLRPESLSEVSEEIDHQVGEALRAYLEDADLYSEGVPGMLCLSLADDVVKRIDILDFAREIAEWPGPAWDWE